MRELCVQAALPLPAAGEVFYWKSCYNKLRIKRSAKKMPFYEEREVARGDFYPPAPSVLLLLLASAAFSSRLENSLCIPFILAYRTYIIKTYTIEWFDFDPRLASSSYPTTLHSTLFFSLALSLSLRFKLRNNRATGSFTRDIKTEAVASSSRSNKFEL